MSVGAFVATRSAGPLLGGVTILDLAALLVAAPAALLILLIRQRLPARVTGQSPDEWWRRHLSRAILLWGLLEGLALLGAVSLFASRRVLGFGVLAAGALAGLLLLTPARLMGE